jgi:BirA family transcriptional regulator, biotin operon repressor / biotin---[acetyl-CoA-carboxylase] ligase
MPPSLAEHPRVEALLSGPLGWHTVEHHHEVGSTNDVALERARAGAPDGLVVVADHQTAGRGRGGHRWEDLPTPGASLLVSALLAPAPPARAAGLARRPASRSPTRSDGRGHAPI